LSEFFNFLNVELLELNIELTEFEFMKMKFFSFLNIEFTKIRTQHRTHEVRLPAGVRELMMLLLVFLLILFFVDAIFY